MNSETKHFYLFISSVIFFTAMMLLSYIYGNVLLSGIGLAGFNIVYLTYSAIKINNRHETEVMAMLVSGYLVITFIVVIFSPSELQTRIAQLLGMIVGVGSFVSFALKHREKKNRRRA